MILSTSFAYRLSIALVLLFFGSHQALGSPVRKVSDDKIESFIQSDAVQGKFFNFEGTVAHGHCSGSLVRFENSQGLDHAMILTNGHCNETGLIGAGKFLYGINSRREFKLFDAHKKNVGTLMALKIIYATMSGTDIALYQLAQTFAEIVKKYSVHAFTLSPTPAHLYASIQVLSGYWQIGYECRMEKFIPQLREGPWIWNDSIRYSRPGCEIIDRTSGSPVVARGTRRIIAINNTANDNGERCTMDNPCEIDLDGNITYKKGYSYAQQTYQIYSCLNARREIDLSLPGCVLFH